MHLRLIVRVLAVAGALLLYGTDSLSQNLDQYGGYRDLPAPGGATGFFRVEKIGNRWVFVTPLGNAFWYRGVQNIGDYFYPGTTKYPGGKSEWATQVRRRLKRWGFNAVGEYWAAEVAFGSTDQMPYIFHWRPSNNAIRNLGNFIGEPVKEIINNIPQAVYNGYRGMLIDAFDPKYQTYATLQFNSPWGVVGFVPNGVQDPWLIGYTIEDGDEWFGLTVGSGPDTNVIKPHGGWSVLVSQDPMGSSANPGGYGQQTYNDTTNYSKRALRDFLKTRYSNDLNAFNAAWGSTYTSWDHSGGYGVGSGLLDEAGQNKWVCSSLPCPQNDWNLLGSMTPSAQKDLDDFLQLFAEKLISGAVNAIRTYDQNHLIFGPDTANQWGYVSRAPVLRAMAKWLDVLHVGYQEGPIFTAERLAAPGKTYDITGKPMIYWIGFCANADSAMSAHPNPFGVDCVSTQAQRGQKYASYINNLLNVRGSNGDYPSIGIDWWGWEDQTNENTNWGLVSLKDNAYDGKEATIASGTDPWGFPTGGEAANYGDFLTEVIKANLSVHGALNPGAPSAPPPPTNLVVSP